MDDSIQHLEQEQPVHERKIEPEKLSFDYVLRKIKTFYKSIDIKKRYIFLLVIVLILMLIFTIPFVKKKVKLIFSWLQLSYLLNNLL